MDGTSTTLTGFNADGTAVTQSYTYDASSNLLYSSHLNVDASATYTFNTTNKNSITFDKGTFTAAFYDVTNNVLSVSDGSVRRGDGTLDLNASGGGTVVLPNNQTITLPMQTELHITAVPNASPLDTLSDYLTNLGSPITTTQLVQANFNTENPSQGNVSAQPFPSTMTLIGPNNLTFTFNDITYGDYAGLVYKGLSCSSPLIVTKL